MQLRLLVEIHNKYVNAIIAIPVDVAEFKLGLIQNSLQEFIPQIFCN